MAVTQVVFADHSKLNIFSVGDVEGVTAAQFSLPADVRPIYGWGSAEPIMSISSPTLGSGSFTFVCGNGTGCTINENYKGILDGDDATTVEITGGLTPDGAAVQTVTMKGCAFQNDSFGINAKGEGTRTISFTFKELS